MATTLAHHALGTTAEFGIADIGGIGASVLSFDALTADQSVTLLPETGEAITDWALAMDVYIPSAAAGTYTGLLQTGSGDADLFLRTEGDGAGIGTLGVYEGAVPYDTWVRLAVTVTVEDGNTMLRKFVDGVLVGTQDLGATDRWSIDPDLGLRLFTDNDGETSPGYVSSIFFMANPPDADAVAAALASVPTATAGGFFPVAPGPDAVEVSFEDQTVTTRYGDAAVILEGSDYRTPVAFGDSEIARTGQFGIEEPGGDMAVLHYSAFSPEEGMQVVTPAGTADLTSFTMVWDIRTADTGGYQALLQLDAGNSSDAEFFINAGRGIGISGNYTGTVPADTWARIALTVKDNGDGTSTLVKYIDGAQVGSQTVSTGRFTVDASTGFLILSDNDRETSEGYLAHFGMTETVLTSAEIAALGGVDADGPFAEGEALVQIGFDGYAPAAEFGQGDVVLNDTVPVEEVEPEVNGIQDMLVNPETETQHYDLTEVFGAGAHDFAVTNTNGDAVAASIEDGVLTLDFGEYGLADLVITATTADGLAAEDLVRVRVAGENAYTIAVFPDTQDYTSNPWIEETFSAMTQWVADNAASKNINFVNNVGDVSQWSSVGQFDIAHAAYDILREAGVSFSIVQGNHDIVNSAGDIRDTSNFNDAFSIAYMSEDPTFGGVYAAEPERYDNNYHLWTATDGTEWVTINLEFGPRDDVLAWADQVLTDYGDRKAIIVTHSYNNFNGRHDPLGGPLEGEGAGYDYWLGADPEGAWDGEEIWRDVISSHANVVFALGGHIFGDGAETVVSYNDYGNKVYQFLMNYQDGVALEATEGGNGGNGAIRLITVDPDNDAIYTETYFAELDEYFTGYRETEEASRDGLTGSYVGHQEEFYDADIGAREAPAEAHAGDDMVVTAEAGAATASVALSAAASTDPKGDTLTYTWTDEDGTVIATGMDASVDLGAGVHDLTLTIETAEGVVSSDDLRVIVETDQTWLVETFDDGAAQGWAAPAAGGEVEGVTAFGTDLGFSLASISGVSQRELTLSFDSHWRPEDSQIAEVLVSVDGETPYAILHWDSDNTSDDGSNQNEHVTLDFLVPDSAASVEVFWKMSEAGNDWYWAVDNISLADDAGTVLLFEDFESVADDLQPAEDENIAEDILGWTHDAPDGWAVDTPDSVPEGTAEWRGWSFTTMKFWTAADTQDRANFTLGNGVFAVADPDEWDDFNGGSDTSTDYETSLVSPVVDLGGAGGDASAVAVLSVPALDQTQGLKVVPTVSGEISEYTLIYDIYVEDGQGTWTALFQTDLTNSGDGELFIANGGIGISAVYEGAFDYDAWNRVAFTFSVIDGAQVLNKYINGTLVGTQTVDSDISDGSRWSFDGDEGFLLFADENGETSDLYAASFAFTPEALDAATIAAMGGVDADGPLAGPQAEGAVQLTFDGALDAATIGSAEVSEIDLSAGELLGDFDIIGSAMADDGAVGAAEAALYQRSNAVDAVVFYQDGAWSDLVLEVTMRSMDDDTMGVVFNADGAGSYYLLTFDNQTNLRQLLRVEGTEATLLASEAGGYTFNVEQDLVVSNVGGRITATLDGVALFGGAVVDTDPLGAGTVGLYSSNQHSAIFDDVIVRAPELNADAGPDILAIDWDRDGVETIGLDGSASILPGGSAEAVWSGRGLEAAGLTVDAEVQAGRNHYALTLDGSASDEVTVDLATGERLIAADRFEDGDALGWTFVDTTELASDGTTAAGTADWQVIDGALVETSGAYSRELTWNGASNADVWQRGWSPLGDGTYALHKGSFALWNGDTDLTDYTIRADVTAPSGAVGFMLNYVDENNYYKIELDARVNLWTFVKVVDNYESMLARGAMSYTPGDTFTLQAQIVDGKVSATIDGHDIFAYAVELHDIESGAAGVWSWGAAGASFDDIAIVDLSTDFAVELHGGEGNDRLFGTDADEFIWTGAGRMDQASGGLGADTFVFADETANGVRETDRIADFDAGLDRIDLGGAEVQDYRETGHAVYLWIGEDRDQVIVQGVDHFDDISFA